LKKSEIIYHQGIFYANNNPRQTASEKNMKKQIIWIIQSNQITPAIKEFLELFQYRIQNQSDLVFMVPDSSQDTIKTLGPLSPRPLKINTRTATQSYQAYTAQRSLLEGGEFTEGLSFSDVLLLDDLAGGNVQQTFIEMNDTSNIGCVLLQIPTPLGSSAAEEKIFSAVIHWASQQKIPVIGYELLPLDTCWTLAPSLPDGIVTRDADSFTRLKNQLPHDNIWQLPRYEGSIFSPAATSFNIQGAKAAYHYINHLSIPPDRTILYIPHNVAMIHEYHVLLDHLRPFGKKLHLMFTTGSDQTRGGHAHHELIETVYKNTLAEFASYSFHKTNYTWEIFMADCVLSCASCLYTMMAAEKNIPYAIFDPAIPETDVFQKTIINSKTGLLDHIEKIIQTHTHQVDLGTILLKTCQFTKGS